MKKALDWVVRIRALERLKNPHQTKNKIFTDVFRVGGRDPKIMKVQEHWRFSLQLGQFYLNRMIYRRETGVILPPLIPARTGNKTVKVRAVTIYGGASLRWLKELLEDAINARREALADEDHFDITRKKIWETRAYPPVESKEVKRLGRHKNFDEPENELTVEYQGTD